MDAFKGYVHDELRRLRPSQPTREMLHREEWLRDRPSTARTAARWLGERLVGAGFWLQSWSSRTGTAARPPEARSA